jgi:hypothetical protein
MKHKGIAIFRHLSGTPVEGINGKALTSINRDAVHPLKCLIIPDNTDNFPIIILFRIFLTVSDVIILFSAVKTAKNVEFIINTLLRY